MTPELPSPDSPPLIQSARRDIRLLPKVPPLGEGMSKSARAQLRGTGGRLTSKLAILTPSISLVGEHGEWARSSPMATPLWEIR